MKFTWTGPWGLRYLDLMSWWRTKLSWDPDLTPSHWNKIDFVNVKQYCIYLFGGLEVCTTGEDDKNEDDDEKMISSPVSDDPGYTVRVSAAEITSWYVMLLKSSNWLMLSVLGMEEFWRCFRSSSLNSWCDVYILTFLDEGFITIQS